MQKHYQTSYLNGTNNKKNQSIYITKKTFTLLEYHYFQEKLEQYQFPFFTVFHSTKLYTGTFNFLPAGKD